MPSDGREITVVADKDQLGTLLMDPALMYAPSPHTGTIHWPRIVPPSDENPRDRLRDR